MFQNHSRSPGNSSASPRKLVRLDNEVSVVTPEYIEFQFRVAGPIRRVIAMIVDYLLLVFAIVAMWLIFGLFFLLISLVSRNLGNLGGSFLESVAGVGIGVGLVLFFFLWWFSGAFLEAWYGGQTIGKKMLGIQVVSTDGRAISLFQAMVRNFLRMADAVPLFPTIFFYTTDSFLGEVSAGITSLPPVFPTFIVGLFVMITSRKMQRVGDICAGTMVVHKVKKFHEILPVFDDEKLLKMALKIPAGFTPTAALTDTLSLYVSRRGRFHPERLAEISGHLIEPLLDSWNWKKSGNYDLVAGAIYLRCVFNSNSLNEMYDKKQAEKRKQTADPFASGNSSYSSDDMFQVNGQSWQIDTPEEAVDGGVSLNENEPEIVFTEGQEQKQNTKADDFGSSGGLL